MQQEKPPLRGILVVDPDTGFLEQVMKDPRNSRAPAITASTIRDAQLLIADKTRPLIALFINPVLPTAFDITLIRHAHHYRPSTPIYLLHDLPLPLSQKEFESIGIQNLLQKPVTYTQIVDIADPPHFQASNALAHATAENVGEEIEAENDKFKPIRAADFIAGSKSFFDIFVQLGAERFLKIVKAGDSFDPERVVSYIKKGVKFFFIKKEAQESYLVYCDQLSQSIIQSQKISTPVKVSHILNVGEEVISYFRQNGISESGLVYANNYVAKIHDTLERTRTDRFEAVKKFLSDVAALEHSNACAMMASLMLGPLEFKDPDTISAIGLASMFHDIGLQDMPENMRNEDESKMSAEEIEVYRQHPTKGAMLLGELRAIPEASVQAIQQHHERRTRQGFPHALGAGSINGIAEIVGICDEFVNALKLAKSQQAFDPIHHMETRVFNGFSAQLVDAFRKGIFRK